MDREERIHQLEYEVDGLHNDLQRKNKHNTELQEVINEMKIDLAALKEQKNSAEREVSLKNSCGYMYIKVLINTMKHNYVFHRPFPLYFNPSPIVIYEKNSSAKVAMNTVGSLIW